MAYRDRDRDEEFRGGAEERGERSQYGRSDYEERNRGPQQFGREHETGGRSQGWQSGRGYSGESQGYGSPGYGSQGYGSQGGPQSQSYRSQGYGSQGFGSQGYRPQSNEIPGRYGSPGTSSQFGQGGYERGFEGMDRESGWGGFPTSGGYGQTGFREGTSSQYGRSFGPPGYSESQFGPTRTRGRYTGRGPKNYTRSDDRIREDVSDRLEQHGEIDATEIEVRVEGAEVTLEGTVSDRWTKRLAEDVVEDTPGVKQVHNRLRIQGNGGESDFNRSQSASGSQSTSGSQRGQSTTGSTSKSTTRS